VKIDREIEARRAKPSNEREIRDDPFTRRDDHFVEVRITRDEGSGVRLDDIGEMRFGKRERRARMAGVVNTTSRSAANRMSKHAFSFRWSPRR